MRRQDFMGTKQRCQSLENVHQTASRVVLWYYKRVLLLMLIMVLKHHKNMFVIGHADLGKSTLTNSPMVAAGIIAQVVVGITIKSTGMSLYYEMTDATLKSFMGKRNRSEYLINLIDSPRHIDFSSKVTTSLRITLALVVIYCIKGVYV